MAQRLKILYVSAELIPHLFRQNDGRQIYFEGMPDDAKLVGVSDQYGFDHNLIGFKFESETFPEVEPGHKIPELRVTINPVNPQEAKRGSEFL